jgi:hypothetical protein
MFGDAEVKTAAVELNAQRALCRDRLYAITSRQPTIGAGMAAIPAATRRLIAATSSKSPLAALAGPAAKTVVFSVNRAGTPVAWASKRCDARAG